MHEGGVASSIAVWDTVIKFVLYYFHERLWQNIPLGIVRQYHVFRRWAKRVIPQDYHKTAVRRESHVRSILKGVSWRITGTTTTILVAYVLTGNVTSALTIGGIEVFTKFILYYLHARAWQRIPRGGIRRILNKFKY